MAGCQTIPSWEGFGAGVVAVDGWLVVAVALAAWAAVVVVVVVVVAVAMVGAELEVGATRCTFCGRWTQDGNHSLSSASSRPSSSCNKLANNCFFNLMEALSLSCAVVEEEVSNIVVRSCSGLAVEAGTTSERSSSSSSSDEDW